MTLAFRSAIYVAFDRFPTFQGEVFGGPESSPALNRLASESLTTICHMDRSDADFGPLSETIGGAGGCVVDIELGDNVEAHVHAALTSKTAEMISPGGGAIGFHVHTCGSSHDGTTREIDSPFPNEIFQNLDETVGRLLDSVSGRQRDESSTAEPLLIVTALSGVACQPAVPETLRSFEHPCPPQLSQVPLWIRTPNGSGWRSPMLLQLSDVWQTIVTCCSADNNSGADVKMGHDLSAVINGTGEHRRKCVWTRGHDADVLRTERFTLVADRSLHDVPVDEAMHEVLLFLKPEDQWEQINRASEYPAQVIAMLKRLGDIVDADATNNRDAVLQLTSSPVELPVNE